MLERDRFAYYRSDNIRRILKQYLSADYPNADSTGPSGALTPVSGNLQINTNGTVVQNELRTGTYTVNADNVTIRNCKVIADDFSAIWNNGSNLLIEDVEIDLPLDAGYTGITYQSFTARRCEIYGGENLIWAESGVIVIEDCYIHDPVSSLIPAAPHTDCIQIPHDAPGDITIRHNTIYGGHNSLDDFGNSAITAAENTQIAGTVLVENNLMAGGGFALRPPANTCDFTWINNHFSTIFFSTVGGFDPCSHTDVNTFYGNVIHETGAPYP